MCHGRCSTTLMLAAVLLVAAPPAAAERQRAVIEAVQRSVISSELSARIESLPRREGEAFVAGEPLVEMACAVYRAEQNKVEIRLRQARRKLENRKRLEELDSVGRLAVDLARLDVRESEAELDIVTLNVERCTIEAPFDGRVVERRAREHQSVQRQQEVLEIVGMALEARIIVPAQWLAWLEPGAPVEIAVDETGARIDGAIERIGAAVDPVSHTVPVWASLDGVSAALRPGMSGSARFPGRPGDGS
ncbi:MAG: efflux RND transporter periplasmic adaptor subunit [Halofilum sp. (in: g-proteobacteria)]|nr:efflux RND transporter periplasmic adaptor subunit [Halofilum sp. (in: g-proteobacteria)]